MSARRPPATLATSRDGTRWTIRAIEPADWAELQRLHLRLSPRSRRRRFLSELRTLPEPLARRFAAVDFEDAAAFVAQRPGETAIRGVARFARDAEERELADIAVVVEDAFQRRGLGQLLMRRLAAFAWECGIRRFRAEVLGENAEVLALFRRLGFPFEVQPDLELLRVEIVLAPPQGPS